MAVDGTPGPAPLLNYDALQAVLARLEAVPPPPFSTIKLTQEQLDELKQTVPTDTSPAPTPLLTGIPIVLVDDIRESTPFQLALARALRSRDFDARNEHA